jgi:hypothetical protein
MRIFLLQWVALEWSSRKGLILDGDGDCFHCHRFSAVRVMWGIISRSARRWALLVPGGGSLAMLSVVGCVERV